MTAPAPRPGDVIVIDSFMSATVFDMPGYGWTSCYESPTGTIGMVITTAGEGSVDSGAEVFVLLGCGRVGWVQAGLIKIVKSADE